MIELFASIMLFIGSIFLYSEILKTPEGMGRAVRFTGPAVWPRLLIILLALMSVIWIIKNNIFLRSKLISEDKDAKSNFKENFKIFKDRYFKTFFPIVLSYFFIFVLSRYGLAPASFIFFAAVIYQQGIRSLPRCIFYSLALTIILILIFLEAFNLPISSGLPF